MCQIEYIILCIGQGRIQKMGSSGTPHTLALEYAYWKQNVISFYREYLLQIYLFLNNLCYFVVNF